MSISNRRTYERVRRTLSGFLILCAAFIGFSGLTAQAQSVAYMQAVATASANDAAISTFYKERNYRPIWTGNGDSQRRRAFVEAAKSAGDHGLPTGRYDAQQLLADFASVRSPKGRGILEVETTRRFLQYAQDIQSGILDPNRLSQDVATIAPRRDRLSLLKAFAQSTPTAFIRKLPPSHPDYARLLKEKARIERVLGAGGWGPLVKAKSLKPGNSGDAVIALRDRLTAMGYRGAGNSTSYDDAMVRVVQAFQIDRGLNPDGVAGQSTIAAANISAQTMLQQVIIGLERQRWLNIDRGQRHIFVNQADFMAYVMDSGKPTLSTRVVVGKASSQYRTPEFTDEMTHLIINPTWHVPQSIARKEYLPMLLENPAALGRQGIVMKDGAGRRVDPTTLDYSQFSTSNFPFDLSQPPSPGNALGKVKFMFPNKFNVYLHDTPSKSLFGRDIRAFSHGCVRVQKPFELAYTLLARQTSNPKGLFTKYLNTGLETVVDLEKPIPVHLVYHSVWVTAQGHANYRLDTYGRDKLVFSALTKAGVVLRAVQG